MRQLISISILFSFLLGCSGFEVDEFALRPFIHERSFASERANGFLSKVLPLLNYEVISFDIKEVKTGEITTKNFEIKVRLCTQSSSQSSPSSKPQCNARLGEFSIKGEELEQIAVFDRKQVFPNFSENYIDNFGKAVKLKLKLGKIRFKIDEDAEERYGMAMRAAFRSSCKNVPGFSIGNDDEAGIILNGCRFFEGDFFVPGEDKDNEYTTTFALLETNDTKPDFFKTPQSFYLGYYSRLWGNDVSGQDNCTSPYSRTKNRPQRCIHLKGKMTRKR